MGGGSSPKAQFDYKWLTPPNSYYPTLPVSEFNYEDGVLKGTRGYNAEMNTYLTQTYKTPEEKSTQNAARAGLQNTLDNVTKTFGNIPGQMKGYQEALAGPQRQALMRGYQDAVGTATNRANAMGMDNSVGFENYRAKQLDRQMAEGLADIENQSYLQSFQLPSLMMSPYQDMFNMYTAALGGEQAAVNNNVNNLMGGAAQGLNAFNAMNSFSRPRLVGPSGYSQGGGGFLGGLF